MRKHAELTEAGRQYVAAYAAHYTGHDLVLALNLYKRLMVSHPNAQEAGYCRTQIHNIVKVAVPKQQLLDAEMELALAHIERDGPLEVGRTPVTPPVPGILT